MIWRNVNSFCKLAKNFHALKSQRNAKLSVTKILDTLIGLTQQTTTFFTSRDQIRTFSTKIVGLFWIFDCGMFGRLTWGACYVTVMLDWGKDVLRGRKGSGPQFGFQSWWMMCNLGTIAEGNMESMKGKLKYLDQCFMVSWDWWLRSQYDWENPIFSDYWSKLWRCSKRCVSKT